MAPNLELRGNNGDPLSLKLFLSVFHHSNKKETNTVCVCVKVYVCMRAQVGDIYVHMYILHVESSGNSGVVPPELSTCVCFVFDKISHWDLWLIFRLVWLANEPQDPPATASPVL